MEETVEKTTGKGLIPLVHALKNKKDVSEFTLASALKKDINETRNLLYQLYNQNLVSSTRKKDKHKGWYVYYWTLNANRMKYLAEKSKEVMLNRLQQRLEREKSTDFFVCGSGCIRLDFERATDLKFKCPECGSIVHNQDNSITIKELENNIKKLSST